MYAIIESGGKQYKVSEGLKVRLEKVPTAEGEAVTIREVLVINDGTAVVLGSPYIGGASVQGKVLAHGKAKKVTMFTYKRRKDYKKKKGHRQPFTELLIEKIEMEANHGA
jgi:large subunit ribosomal protein L21